MTICSIPNGRAHGLLVALLAPTARAQNGRIVFGFTAVTDFTSVFVAAEEGFFKKRKLDENALIDGAVIVGGAKLVEFMGEACPSLSY